MRYYSPYSSRTRPPIWPKFLIVFLVLAILGSGGWLAWSLNNRQSSGPVAGINATVTNASAVAGNSTAPAVGAPAVAAPGATAPSASVVAANGTVAVGPNALSRPAVGGGHLCPGVECGGLSDDVSDHLIPCAGRHHP